MPEPSAILGQPATLDDVRKSAQDTLTQAGLTECELREQARTGQFTSLRARMAWVVVSALEPGTCSTGRRSTTRRS